MPRNLQKRWGLQAALVLLLTGAGSLRAQIYHTFDVVPNPACPGEAIRIVGRSTNGVGLPLGQPGDSLYWHVDKQVVRTNANTNYVASFLNPGIYPFTITLMRQGRTLSIWHGPINVLAGPAVRLGPDTTVCGRVAVRLAPRNALPAGSTLAWPDGSSGPFFLATAPGTYWLEVSSPGNRCVTRVSRVINVRADCVPDLKEPAVGSIPNIITPNDDKQNDFFVLDGLVPAEWQVQVFNRWGREVFRQEQYNNGWDAQGQAAGLYYYLLRHAPSGQRRRGWVEVVK